MMPLIVSEMFATAAVQSNSQKSVSQATACRKKIQKKSISNTMINSDEQLSQLSRRRGQSLQSKYKAASNILNRTMTKTHAGGGATTTNQGRQPGGDLLVDDVLSGRKTGNSSLRGDNNMSLLDMLHNQANNDSNASYKVVAGIHQHNQSSR